TRRQIQLHGNGTLDIELEEDITPLKEVIIEAEKDKNVAGMQISVTYMAPPPRIISWSILRRNLQMTISAEPGFTYVIDSSDNMIEWTTYHTVVASSRTVTVSSSLSGANQKFFRVKAKTP
ncbi:MAG: hypothetical protein ACO1QB_18375, partial [Verrucomicrobiales bacterium]